MGIRVKHGIFHKYLISFASFFIVPLVVLAICLQFTMYNNLSREIATYNKNVLERLGDELIDINGRLMEVGNYISFRTPSVSETENMAVQLDLIDLLRINSTYDSKKYLIYKDNAECFSSSGVYNRDYFIKNELRVDTEQGDAFFEKLYTIKKPFYMTIQKQYNLKNGPAYRPQVLFIYPVRNYSGLQDAWVIVEMKDKDLNMSVSSGGYNNGITILNKEGEILLVSGNPVSVDEKMNSLISMDDGIVELDVDGKSGKRELAYVLSNPDMIILNEIEMPDLMSGLKGSSPLVLGFLLFLVLGCILAIYVAYHYYKPIRQLAQYMKKEDEPEHEKKSFGKDELDYIRVQYDSLNSIKEKLSREIESQWPLVEERLITGLLYGNKPEISQENIIDKVFYSNQENKKHFVFLASGKPHREQEFILKYKENSGKIKEILERNYAVLCSYLYQYEAIVIIVGGEKTEEADQKKVENTVIEILGEEMITGIGSIYDNSEGIHISFLEALTELKYRLLNPNKEYKREAAEEEETGYISRISQCQTECLLILSRCFDKPNPEEIEKTVQEIELNLEELPGQVGLMCCYDLISRLMEEVKKRGMRLDEKEIFSLTSFRTIEEFMENFKKTLEKLCGEIRKAKMETQTVLMKQIESYIEERYQDSSFSLVEIADYFGYTPSHMSKLISQNMNQSFSEILQEKRLNYTKNCLINTNKPIAQIAQEAGYTNISNFTRRFKSSENITPGQYRNLYYQKEQ